MAVFRTDEDLDRLDGQLLRRGPAILYHRAAILAEDVAWLQQHRYEVHAFDCSGWHSEADFHDTVSSGLGFPAYYGRNLNALHDCLSELEVPDLGGTALQFNRFDHFIEGFSLLAWNVLDTIAQNSWQFLLRGRRLMVLVQSDNPRLGLEKVGGHCVLWNPREWLDSSRGV